MRAIPGWPGTPSSLLASVLQAARFDFIIRQIRSLFLGVGALTQACIATTSSYPITDQRELAKLSTARRQAPRTTASASFCAS